MHDAYGYCEDILISMEQNHAHGRETIRTDVHVAKTWPAAVTTTGPVTSHTPLRYLAAYCVVYVFFCYRTTPAVEASLPRDITVVVRADPNTADLGEICLATRPSTPLKNADLN